jgi:serine/threonine protein kinase
VAETEIGPGSVLAGRFVLEDLLDETEGAKFWRATDKILARNVAVHVIGSEDPRAEALVSAARTSATVTDGHLLRVLDAASEEGYTYVVNEWGNGISLDRLLTEGPLSPRRAAWVAKEVAEAISTAHRHGIAHGRLLPENVVITESGGVKLIGFVVDAVLNGRESVRVTGGRPLAEHEADVVNLAALLYAGLVARWPGTEGSIVQDAPAEQGRPMRPRQVRAGVPRPLDAICERVLNPDGHHHVTPIETAHEVYAALCDYIGDPGSPAPLGDPPSLLDEEEAERLREVEDGGPPTQAASAPGSPDPEATQAGQPDFGDTAERKTMAGLRRDTEERTRVVPPPPPFRDPEPRPLFASEHPRQPRPAPDRPRSTGFGSGTIPPVWGPDAADETSGGRHRGESAYVDEPPGRSWMRLAFAVGGVLVLVLAIIFAFNLGRDSTSPEDEAVTDASGQPSRASAPRALTLNASNLDDFDPEGDGQEESPDTVPLAVDGNPTTAWRTSTYFDPLSLQKSGVGLMVDLGEPTDVSDVRLTMIGAGTDLELRAAPDATTAPTSPEQMRVVAQQAGAGTDVTLEPNRPVTTQYLLIWLTELPAVEGGFRGQVAEVVVRS